VRKCQILTCGETSIEIMGVVEESNRYNLSWKRKGMGMSSNEVCRVFTQHSSPVPSSCISCAKLVRGQHKCPQEHPTGMGKLIQVDSCHARTNTTSGAPAPTYRFFSVAKVCWGDSTVGPVGPAAQ